MAQHIALEYKRDFSYFHYYSPLRLSLLHQNAAIQNRFNYAERRYIYTTDYRLLGALLLSPEHIFGFVKLLLKVHFTDEHKNNGTFEYIMRCAYVEKREQFSVASVIFGDADDMSACQLK